jgi:hypothetical protein
VAWLAAVVPEAVTVAAAAGLAENVVAARNASPAIASVCVALRMVDAHL